MAIQWTEYELDNSHPRKVKRTWTSHEGLVVGETYVREVKPMSDIYCDASFVRVWNPEKGEAEVVRLGTHFELCNTFGTATIDAPADILAKVAQQDADAEAARQAAEKARAEAAHQARLLALHNRPEKGKVMQVVRGRKVAKGTVGRVFWLDDLRNPSRVGIALSDAKDDRGNFKHVAWVDAAYLENTAPLSA